MIRGRKCIDTVKGIKTIVPSLNRRQKEYTEEIVQLMRITDNDIIKTADGKKKNNQKDA